MEQKVCTGRWERVLDREVGLWIREGFPGQVRDLDLFLRLGFPRRKDGDFQC